MSLTNTPSFYKIKLTLLAAGSFKAYLETNSLWITPNLQASAYIATFNETSSYLKSNELKCRYAEEYIRLYIPSYVALWKAEREKCKYNELTGTTTINTLESNITASNQQKSILRSYNLLNEDTKDRIATLKKKETFLKNEITDQLVSEIHFIDRLHEKAERLLQAKILKHERERKLNYEKWLLKKNAPVSIPNPAPLLHLSASSTSVEISDIVQSNGKDEALVSFDDQNEATQLDDVLNDNNNDYNCRTPSTCSSNESSNDHFENDDNAQNSEPADDIKTKSSIVPLPKDEDDEDFVDLPFLNDLYNILAPRQ